MRQLFLLLFITQIFLQQKHNQRSINVLWTKKNAFVSFWLIERYYHCVLKLICMINIFEFSSNDCSKENCVYDEVCSKMIQKIMIEKVQQILKNTSQKIAISLCYTNSLINYKFSVLKNDYAIILYYPKSNFSV